MNSCLCLAFIFWFSSSMFSHFSRQCENLIVHLFGPDWYSVLLLVLEVYKSPNPDFAKSAPKQVRSWTCPFWRNCIAIPAGQSMFSSYYTLAMKVIHETAISLFKGYAPWNIKEINFLLDQLVSWVKMNLLILWLDSPWIWFALIKANSDRQITFYFVVEKSYVRTTRHSFIWPAVYFMDISMI